MPGGSDASAAGVQALREGAANVVLDPAMLEEAAAFGDERSTTGGEVLYRAGDAGPAFYVVLDGEIEVLRGDGPDATRVATWGRGGFVGELNLVTGQRLLKDLV